MILKPRFLFSRPHLLTKEQIDKLKILLADGHEIGCHGMNHIKVTEENQYQFEVMKKNRVGAITCNEWKK